MMIRIFAVMMLIGLTGVPHKAQAQDELLDLYSPYKGEERDALDRPHRSISQIAQYLADISVELFSVSQNNMKQDLLKNQAYFTQPAFRTYLQFLQNSGYLPVMQELKLNMSGLNESAPLLLTKGTSDGAYSWVFSVPLTVILSGNRALPEGRLPQPETIALRFQVSRAADAPEPEYIIITGFKGGERPALTEGQQEADNGG